MYPYEIINAICNAIGDTGKAFLTGAGVAVALWALISGIIIIF